MDVFTFSADDSAVSRKPEGKRAHKPVRAREAVRAFEMPRPRNNLRALVSARISFPTDAPIPSLSSFPVLFALGFALFFAVTPLAQERFGLYRLPHIAFPSDARSVAAMRAVVTPEPDASLLAAAGETGLSDLPVSIQTVSYQTYTVRSGDTISSIAARNGLRNISSILSVNSIPNARRVRTGQSLRIPSIDGILYAVVRGDSLERIAARYAIPVTALLDANDLSNATLTAGQRLFIPGASLSSYDLKKALGELFVYPIAGRLTSRFGWRNDPFTGVKTFHTGIDLAAAIGTKIKATLDGKVATTGYSAVYGNYVIISHDDSYQSLYGHMSSIAVKRGDAVTQGTIIGKVGNTGYSTGSHLHFSVYKKGQMVDPLSLLK